MRNAHNILVCNLRLGCRIQFHLFCCFKIYQIMLYNHFCHFISGIWNHAISNDASISCNRDIAGSSSHVHQGNVQHSEVLWNGHINGSNRLQCHIGNSKIRLTYCRIQSIYNIFWKESYDNVTTDHICLVSFQTDKNLIV